MRGVVHEAPAGVPRLWVARFTRGARGEAAERRKSPTRDASRVDLAWRDVGLGVMLLAVAVLLASLRWWPRRRDRATLQGVLAGLNLLVAGAAATLLATWTEIETGLVQALAAWAWYGFLTVAATRAVLPRDEGAQPSGSTLLLRCTLAGFACGPLVLVGILAPFALGGDAGGVFIILMYGGLVAFVVGGAVGFVVGLADALAVRRLTRAAR